MFNEKRREEKMADCKKAKVEEERKKSTNEEGAEGKKVEGKYDYPFWDCLACPIEGFRLHCFCLDVTLLHHHNQVCI